MADPNPTPVPRAESGQINQLSDVVQTVKEYARQETLGPLKGAGRWLALGGVGAVLIGVGAGFVVLGVLRALQSETNAFDGRWTSILPYLIALVLCVAVIGAAAVRINKKSLQKGSTR